MNRAQRKKLFVCIVLSICLLFSMTACKDDTRDKLTVVCTGYPQYDWVRQILGDRKNRFEVIYLLESGVDIHNFQPSVRDIDAVKTCDLLIHTGGEEDAWATDAINTTDKNIKILALTELVELKEEEFVEGMEGAQNDNDIVEYDQHVWLSLKNAQVLVNAIADAVCGLDPQNEEAYRLNAGGYLAQLAYLDGKYEEAAKNAVKEAVLFADRFPFRYLTADYGIAYYAAFDGCSAETEASFDTIAFLTNKVDELDLGVILTLENSDQRLAQTVKNNTAAKDRLILVMNSCQSVTNNHIASGATYLSIMTNNLIVLRKALA